MTEIAGRTLHYRRQKGDSLYGPGFEAERQLLDDIYGITMTYVIKAQQQWQKDQRQIRE